VVARSPTDCQQYEEHGDVRASGPRNIRLAAETCCHIRRVSPDKTRANTQGLRIDVPADRPRG
jgi:hypothetical protein